ncbi:hypothetical protein [Lysinibacillus cavernae]|uniref:hypothetical protein n=1 Tax=Lysinibacillus cavernae TaxID=2666135 RepID=UPI0012D95C0B|nr:hypothetical protein [Lysinibacillus cavernae]
MQKSLKNEGGFSLIEVVSSLILITIILLSFFGLFIQSNKTSKTSSTIVDSTYLAQNEMENIFREIKGRTEEQLAAQLLYTSTDNPQKISCSKNNKFSTIWSYEKQLEGRRFILTIKRHCQYEYLNSIVIEVYEKEVLKSKIENIYSRK